MGGLYKFLRRAADFLIPRGWVFAGVVTLALLWNRAALFRLPQWARFWDPQSGFIGGLILSALWLASFAASVWMWRELLSSLARELF